MLFSTHDWLLRTMAPHKRFIAWQECHKLVIAVYKATEDFPKHELYGLTSQARRAAFSGAANIVEGASRKGRNEFRRFLDISLGSLSELEYSLEVAAALEYLEPAVFRRVGSPTKTSPLLYLEAQECDALVSPPPLRRRSNRRRFSRRRFYPPSIQYTGVKGGLPFSTACTFATAIAAILRRVSSVALPMCGSSTVRGAASKRGWIAGSSV